MKILKASLKDLKSIAKIFWIESSKPPYDKKRTLEKVQHIIKEDFRNNDIYVAIEDNKIVGFVMVSVDSGIKNKLWINELWIIKEYQGKGIGRELMNYIEKIYKNKGIRTFILVADTRKGGAVNFYKKINYKKDNSLVYMKK